VTTFAVATPAWSQSVRVKARTSLWVDASESEGLLEGFLADDNGDRIAGRRITVSSGGSTRSVVTDQSGMFDVPFPLGLRAQTIVVEFSGDPYLEPSSIARDIDPSRLPVELQLILPTVVSLGDPAIEAQVHAEHGGSPVQIQVDVIDPTTERVLAGERTGADGWASMTIATEVVGRPGPHSFHARFDGDGSLAPSLARAEVLVVDATRITLSATPAVVFPEDTVLFGGELSGVFEPIPGQEIALEAGGATVAHATTDADGAFAAEVVARELRHVGELAVVARFRSTLAARSSCESPPVSLRLRDAQPMDWRFVTVPASVTVALLIIVFAMTRQRTKGPGDSRARSATLEIETGFRPSLVPMRTMRRAEHLDISGVVMDPIEHRPVAGAAIAVSGQQGVTSVTAGPDGRFFVGPLTRGSCTVTVGAAGYVAESFPLALPHGGNFHEATINIIQVRHRALEIYRTVARPLLPRQSLWGLWTPRELAVHAVRTHPWLSDDVAALTSCFESMYYSSMVSSMGDLEQIRHLASNLDQTQRGHLTGSSTDS
jgi:hypothetical protein